MAYTLILNPSPSKTKQATHNSQKKQPKTQAYMDFIVCEHKHAPRWCCIFQEYSVTYEVLVQIMHMLWEFKSTNILMFKFIMRDGTKNSIHEVLGIQSE